VRTRRFGPSYGWEMLSGHQPHVYDNIKIEKDTTILALSDLPSIPRSDLNSTHAEIYNSFVRLNLGSALSFPNKDLQYKLTVHERLDVSHDEPKSTRTELRGRTPSFARATSRQQHRRTASTGVRGCALPATIINMNCVVNLFDTNPFQNTFTCDKNVS